MKALEEGEYVRQSGEGIYAAWTALTSALTIPVLPLIAIFALTVYFAWKLGREFASAAPPGAMPAPVDCLDVAGGHACDWPVHDAEEFAVERRRPDPAGAGVVLIGDRRYRFADDVAKALLGFTDAPAH